jgi:hypothetical protein
VRRTRFHLRTLLALVCGAALGAYMARPLLNESVEPSAFACILATILLVSVLPLFLVYLINRYGRMALS